MEGTERLDDFIRGASKLPVLPRVTVRLLNTLDDPDSSSKEIAEIIQAEPTLTARLLKLANSSFYGQRGRIATVLNAVVVLGAKTIRSLALAAWAHTLKSHARNAEEIALMAPVLNHGLAAAVIARTLAEQRHKHLGEDAFMAGLLHDMGRVALLAQLGHTYREKVIDPALSSGRALHEIETAALGFNHQALGAALMRTWSLPPFLATAIERHHDSNIDPQADFLVATVALADDLATRVGLNVALESPRGNRASIAAYFELTTPETCTEFVAQCQEKMNALGEALN